MELENLKTIWDSMQAFQSKDETEIATMLHKTSKSIVNKLKRNVWLEMVFTIVTGVGLLVYAIMLQNGSLKWTSIAVLLVFMVYSFYYAKKLLLLNRFEPGKENLKNTLEVLIADLTGYLKFYKRSYAFFYPVYFIIVLVFALLERGTDEFVRILSKPGIIVFLVAIAVVFFICSMWFTAWYLKKLYGNHLQRLRDLLTDLQSVHVAAGEL